MPIPTTLTSRSRAVAPTTKLAKKSATGRSRSGFVKQPDGTYTIDGVKASNFINKHPKISVQKAPGKPRHLTMAQINAMVALMKIV